MTDWRCVCGELWWTGNPWVTSPSRDRDHWASIGWQLLTVFRACKEVPVFKNQPHLLTTAHALLFIIAPLIRVVSDKLLKRLKGDLYVWLGDSIIKHQGLEKQWWLLIAFLSRSLVFYSNDLSITTANPPLLPFSEHRVKDARCRGRACNLFIPILPTRGRDISSNDIHVIIGGND